jgi:hypothetical protein
LGEPARKFREDWGVMLSRLNDVKFTLTTTRMFVFDVSIGALTSFSMKSWSPQSADRKEKCSCFGHAPQSLTHSPVSPTSISPTILWTTTILCLIQAFGAEIDEAGEQSLCLVGPHFLAPISDWRVKKIKSIQGLRDFLNLSLVVP